MQLQLQLLAGRGTDIKLGGNKVFFMIEQKSKKKKTKKMRKQ